MAYKAKRSKLLKEDFELVDENDKVVHTLHVSLDADDMTVRIGRKYTALTKALAETTEAQRKAESAEDAVKNIETLGRAVADLLEAVFGPEGTQTIISFYEGRYIEMSREVLPFISQCIIPRLVDLKKENRKAMRAKYNRKTRRMWGMF